MDFTWFYKAKNYKWDAYIEEPGINASVSAFLAITWRFIPRIVSGLVHPSYNPLTIRGMKHQVAYPHF